MADSCGKTNERSVLTNAGKFFTSLSEDLLDSQEGLCFMELINTCISYSVTQPVI